MTGGALRDDERALWRAFVAAARGLDRALEQRLQRDAGLSVPDFDVLLALDGAGGRLRAGALAGALGWDRSRVSHQVRRMADRGLVERVECDTDARGTWVEVAAAGTAALAAAGCGYAEVLRARFLDALGEPGLRALLPLVARLGGPEDDAAAAPAALPPPAFSQAASPV